MLLIVVSSTLGHKSLLLVFSNFKFVKSLCEKTCVIYLDPCALVYLFGLSRKRRVSAACIRWDSVVWVIHTILLPSLLDALRVQRPIFLAFMEVPVADCSPVTNRLVGCDGSGHIESLEGFVHRWDC